MTKVARKQSETDMYHVVARGIGKQVIFEDDVDRRCFFELMDHFAEKEQVEFFAWCLMGNHVHFVVRCAFEHLSKFMLRLETTYVKRYNERHLRTGPLFQHPFWSDPVLDDRRMLATVRYVHQNPVNAHMVAMCEAYHWSSYSEYIGAPKIVRTELVLSMLDGVRNFVRFHRVFEKPNRFLDVENVRTRWTREEALAIAHELLGPASVSGICALPKDERDGKLRLLKSTGIAQRHIAWMTGLSTSVVSRA